MSFLDLTDERMEDAVEPKAVNDGEYTLQITNWKTDDNGNVAKKDANDNPYIMPILEVCECPEAEYAKPITHFLRLTHEDMSKKERNGALWALKEFFTAFDIDFTQRIDYEEAIGKKADALLSIQPDEGYGEQNRIQRFILPR